MFFSWVDSISSELVEDEEREKESQHVSSSRRDEARWEGRGGGTDEGHDVVEISVIDLQI